jgi:hypothetical protein
MSQENADVVQRGLEAFNRHDAAALPALCTRGFRDGLLARFRTYTDRKGALKHVGLPE